MKAFQLFFTFQRFSCILYVFFYDSGDFDWFWNRLSRLFSVGTVMLGAVRSSPASGLAARTPGRAAARIIYIYMYIIE